MTIDLLACKVYDNLLPIMSIRSKEGDFDGNCRIKTYGVERFYIIWY